MLLEPMPKLIVGVESIKTAIGFTAAAVIYPANMIGPVFMYKDGRDVWRKSMMHNYSTIPEDKHLKIQEYIRRSAYGWSVINGRGLGRPEALGLAVARALEFCKHSNPTIWTGLGERGDVHIVHTNKEPLASKFIDGIPELVIDSRKTDWRVSAAYALAKNAI